ncbi:hypothetical protein DFH29DRAFT_1042307 [Suillus ampliporus]|nr:hypothetical protein DFH29DRAFT_1042307 [Suillus ampliporus]
MSTVSDTRRTYIYQTEECLCVEDVKGYSGKETGRDTSSIVLLTQLHGISEGGSGVEEGSGAERSAENRRKMKFLVRGHESFIRWSFIEEGLSFGLEAEAEAASEEPWVVPEAVSPHLRLRPSLNSALGLRSGLVGGRPTFLHIAAPTKGATPKNVEECFPP